jgi:hypothetical protein
MEQSTKRCSKCCRLRKTSSFPISTRTQSGLHSRCIDCTKEDKRAARRRYRQKKKEQKERERRSQYIRFSPHSIMKKAVYEQIRQQVEKEISQTVQWPYDNNNPTFPHEKEQIQEIYHNCPEGHCVDHIIPRRNRNICGLHCVANLQYLPADKNIEKGNRFIPYTFSKKVTSGR